MKKILFLIPLLIAIDLYAFSWIAELLTQRSDVAVLIGTALTCGFIMGNFYLIKFLIQKTT